MKNKLILSLFLIAIFITLGIFSHVFAVTGYSDYSSTTISSDEKIVDNKEQIDLGTVVYSKPSSTYNFFDEKGILNTVYASEETVYWSKLDSNQKITKTMSTKVIYGKENASDGIKYLLYTVGGYEYYNKHLYVVYARMPGTNAYEENALALVKYDSNFKEVGKVEVQAKDVNYSNYYTRAGMKFPFYCGNCSIAINNKTNILSVFLGKNRFDGHQDSSVLFFDINKMKFVSDKNNYDVNYAEYIEAGSHNVSHSLAQRVIATTDGGFLLAESGDAHYTRGLEVTKFDPSKTTETSIWSTKTMVHYREGRVGSRGYNSTFHAFGNLIEVSDGYIYLGAMEKTLSRDYAEGQANEPWNLFIQKYKKVDFEEKTPEDLQILKTEVRTTTGSTPEDTSKGSLFLTGNEKDYGIKWLTDIKEDKLVTMVRGIKIENDQVAIIWKESDMKKSEYGGYNVTGNKYFYYMIINKDGKIITPKTQIEGRNLDLSVEEDYTYKDGKIYWSTSNGQGIILHTLDIDALPFKDVKKESWYYNAVKYVYKNDIIKGYNDTTFAPNDNLTRGMMVTILYRMEGEPKISGTPTFPDVQDSKKYYYKAVKWATDNKIVNGYENGNFGPNDNIQRQQLAVILNKYAKYKGKDVSKTDDLKGFTDSNKISSYAVSQMKWAVGAGVISGNDNKQTGERTLNPKGEATRAEVAAMMEKYCKNVGR